jgi:hypothetical protein
MRSEELIATLTQIRELTTRCLTALGSPKVKQGGNTKSVGSLATAKNALPNHILRLREAGFFKQPRVSREVHEKLGSTYPCDANRVTMALLRLKNRKQLRKASKNVSDKKQVAYVW